MPELTHDIRVASLVNEVIIVCETCEDEIGASFRPLSLDEIQQCIDFHVNGDPDD